MLIVEAATLRAQKKKQNAATAEWANTPKKNENKHLLVNKQNSSKQKILEATMTTKKSKKYDLTNKADYKHKPHEAIKKKNQNTNKGINTFFPISNE